MEYLGTVAATKVISSFYSKEKKAVSICNTTTTSTEPKGKGTSEKKLPYKNPTQTASVIQPNKRLGK